MANKSDPNYPYPTTFVQADTSSFKHVVQLLTGTAKPVNQSPNPTRTYPIPPMKPKQSFKLYERRTSFKKSNISPLTPKHTCSIKHDIMSPSMLDFPSLSLSPVTPLSPDPFTRSSCHLLNGAEIDFGAEDKAIARKGFYLHKSPATTPRVSEPKLLTLFPLTSPKISNGVV